MRTVSLIIMIASIAIAAGLPIAFLFRHPGKKMDDKPFRHWIISISVAVVIGLAALTVYGLTA
jgi:quinol-cytochrome oxidoreductase complex cytochrome b subunit